MSVTYEITTTYQPHTCGKCGVQFAMTTTFYRQRMRDKNTWYCPNGCLRAFTGESEEEKLRRQLDSVVEGKRALRYRLDHANRSRAALKGQVTKIKRRVGKGICPCCRRNFANLKRHMEHQHPDWSEESA